MSENPNKQGRRCPWVRFEREYAGATVHMNWYRNERDQQVLAWELGRWDITVNAVSISVTEDTPALK